MSKASEWREKMRHAEVGYQAGPKSGTPVDSRIPDSWEEADTVTESDVVRQIRDRGEPPPTILTRFAKKVLPVYAQPSDTLYTYTYQLVGGRAPLQVYNDQVEGIGCQVTLINYGDGAGSGHVLIAPQGEFIQASTSGNHQANGIMLPPPGSGQLGLPFLLSTRQGLWAVCVDAVTAFLGVIVESYTPDAHTWEPWEPGQQ
jgi:hypothetical protein